jgi:hypothetical protein
MGLQSKAFERVCVLFLNVTRSGLPNFWLTCAKLQSGRFPSHVALTDAPVFKIYVAQPTFLYSEVMVCACACVCRLKHGCYQITLQ